MDLTTHFSFLVFALFVKVCQTCIDDPTFSQGGKNCSSHVAMASYNCYDNNVETSCCASCAAVKRNDNGCEYGDRKACFVFECDSLIDKSECCETCGTPATTRSTTSTASPFTTSSSTSSSSTVVTTSTSTTTTPMSSSSTTTPPTSTTVTITTPSTSTTTVSPSINTTNAPTTSATSPTTMRTSTITPSTSSTTTMPSTTSTTTTPSTRTTTTATSPTTSTTSTSTTTYTSALPVTSAATSATSSTTTTTKRTTLSTSDAPTVISISSTSQTSPATTAPSVRSSFSPQSSLTTVSAMPTVLSSGTIEQSSITDLTTGNTSTTPLSMSTSNLTTASNKTSSVSPDVTEASSRVLSKLELGFVIGFSSIGLVLLLAAAGLAAYCWRRKCGCGSTLKYSKSDYRLMGHSYIGRGYKLPATGRHADLSIGSLPQTNEVYVPYSGYSSLQNGYPGSLYYSSVLPQTSSSSQNPHTPYLYDVYDSGVPGNGGSKRPYSVSDRYLYRTHRSNSNLSTRNSDVNNGGWRRSTSALYSDLPRSRVS